MGLHIYWDWRQAVHQAVFQSVFLAAKVLVVCVVLWWVKRDRRARVTRSGR